MKKLFLAAAIAAMATQAQAALFHFTGNLTYHNDVARIDFNVAQDATNVRVWTDSFMSGQNFDPITALWKADGTKIEENDDDSSINPQTQTRWDSGFSLPTLAAGNYIFTLAAYNNFANATLANGFQLDDQSPTLMANWDQPANGRGKGGYWSVWLDGVDTASNQNNVPEPASLALAGVALLGLVATRRRA